MRDRLGAIYWKDLVRECSEDVEKVSRMRPDSPKETVSATLVEALDLFLQHCDEFNGRDLIGLCKVVNHQTLLGKRNLDGILLDLLKTFVRTGSTEKEAGACHCNET